MAFLFLYTKYNLPAINTMSRFFVISKKILVIAVALIFVRPRAAPADSYPNSLLIFVAAVCLSRYAVQYGSSLSGSPPFFLIAFLAFVIAYFTALLPVYCHFADRR